MKRLTEKLSQELKRLIKKYVVLLKLERWHIDAVLSEKDIITYANGKTKKVLPDFYAEVIYNYLTKQASITLTKLQVKEPDLLEDTIFHELLHIKFSPLIQLAESCVNVAGLKKEKTEQLIAEIDTDEHEIISTLTKLFLKRGKKNGR